MSNLLPAHLPRPPRRFPIQRGLGLVEMMVVLTVIAIVVRFTIPAYTDFVGRAGIAAMQNELTSDIAFARIEALRRQTTVTLCSASGPGTTCSNSSDWRAGRIIYCNDANATGACCPDGQGACTNPPTSLALKARQAQTSGAATLSGPTGAIVFHANGSISGVYNPSFTVCYKGQTGRQVGMGMAGQIVQADTASVCP